MALYGWKIDTSVALAYIRNNFELMQDLVLRYLEDKPNCSESYIQFFRDISAEDDDETIYDMITCIPIGFCNKFSFQIYPDACETGDDYFCCKLEGEFSIGKTLDLFAIPIQSDGYPVLREQARSLGAY